MEEGRSSGGRVGGFGSREEDGQRVLGTKPSVLTRFEGDIRSSKRTRTRQKTHGNIHFRSSLLPVRPIESKGEEILARGYNRP
jgi:hypothetical protein